MTHVSRNDIPRCAGDIVSVIQSGHVLANLFLRNRDRFIAEHLEFDRIPSISALPQHKADNARGGSGRWPA
jgi:hypothetical protein